MSVAPDFLVELTPRGPELVLTGPWSDAAGARLRSGGVDRLVLNYARGFAGPGLDFLEPGLRLRSLQILDRSLGDLAPIVRLAGSLQELSVEAAPGAVLDLAALPQLRSVSGPWALLAPSVGSCALLASVTMWSYSEATLLPLARLRGMLELTVGDAPALASLGGVEAMDGLQAIRIVRAPSLAGAEPLRSISGLEEVQFEACPRLTSLGDLGHLRGLRILVFADCGPVESLAPLEGLPSLEVVHLWGSTRIEDGDLGPLTRLPALRELRIRPRRHYRPPATELPAAVW